MGWWEVIKFLLQGEQELREHSTEEFHYKVDRLRIEVRWKNYRRFRGWLRFSDGYQGLLQLAITFNPGLDEKLFDSLRTLGETVFFVTAEMTAEDIIESTDYAMQRDCPHVVELLIRGPRDVDDVVAYFNRLRDISDRAPQRLNGPLTEKEQTAMGYWVSTLANVGHTGHFFSPLTPALVVSEVGRKCGAGDYK